MGKGQRKNFLTQFLQQQRHHKNCFCLQRIMSYLTYTKKKREKFERGCRKAPFPRSMSTPCKRKRLVFDDSSEISAAEALLNMSMIQMGDSSIVPALPKSKNKVDVGIQTEPVLVLPVDAQLKQDAVTQTVYEKYEL
ncbi:uncharacterized protein LOC141905755 isoform X1 [Tubulanus polymorphus]|uniref:uncharacterized protein LOC141905755 isoform X1 n=1 Tax=Tubulanus polymorphus TaxID=672921 RepID=UPI003DA3E0AD